VLIRSTIQQSINNSRGDSEESNQIKKKFKYGQEMLPANIGPGYNNLQIYQPVSNQCQTIIGPVLPPTQTPLHMYSQQFSPNTFTSPCNPQPITENPMPLPSHHNQLERMNPTTDDKQENDITENINMVDWQLVKGIKRRKSNKVFQNNNSPEPAVTTNNTY
jgi:hypothetical protein